MRVLVVTSPWPTHYFVMQPLAGAFRAAGHEVLIAAQASMSDLVTRSGLPMVAIDGDVDLVGIRRRTLSRELQAREKPAQAAGGEGNEVFDSWREATLSNLDSVVEFASAWLPDLIVADTMSPAGLVAARVLGIPGIRHLWGWDFLGSVEGEKLLSALPGFYEPYERYGLKVTGDPATRTVDPCPPSLQPPGSPTRISMQYVPYNGPGSVPSGLPPRAEGRPRICLTWGRSITRIIGDKAFLLPQIIRAVDGIDADFVVAIDPADRDGLGELPPNVVALDAPPLHLLLDTCDAIVHQGGSGTVYNAIRYGLPQLAITHMADQDNISAALEKSGAGIHLRSEEATAEAIRRAVARLVDDSGIAHAAARLRAEMLSQPAPAQVVAELEQLAASASRPRD
ncbi:glycosyl transferase [Kitasatospora phosalacinea]|uniref:Glycosyl transferase n=1 Tax=Kitasatospora phosalacinea TaxID=2065 RepID=A0A9W6QGJ5_9ACTN|nr:nucleotide disphospho-sugar-binding domain-containing protein [Kitasatospora phosalacinea]GLW74438.1 glycosyl transferase [Kitasatospora phosalacinea]